MKKMFLFLGAAAIIGVGSAFTSAMLTPPTPGTYVLVGGTWEPVSSHINMDCEASLQICTYNKTGSDPGENGEYQNEDNFDPADEGTPRNL